MLPLIDRHWIWMFGIDEDRFYSSPLTVTANRSPFFDGYSGAWIFRREDRWIVTVPPDLRDEVEARSVDIPPDRRHSDSGIRELFGDRVSRIIGPAYQGAVDRTTFRAFDRYPTRLLTQYDRDTLANFIAECPAEDIEDSGVRIDDESLYGCFVDGALASLAKVTAISPFADTLGVVTHPAYRGQGCGKAAVSAAMTKILQSGKVVTYQTLASNAPSVAIAMALGCVDYACHVAVRLG